MIQRIQSIYLLIVTGLLIATMCLPVGQFIASDGVTAYIFKPLGGDADGRHLSIYMGVIRNFVFKCSRGILYYLSLP